jgi:hypothetical protein
VQQVSLEPGLARPLNVFFSYSSDSQPFIDGLYRHTSFRAILAAKIFDYRDRSLKIGRLRDGLRKLIADCDLFIAFIGGVYAQNGTTAFEFEQAMQMVIDGKSRVRDVIFVILDADGAAWWNARRKQNDIKQWRDEPVWLDCQNAQGSGPRAFASDTALVTDFNDLARQLRASLEAET